MFNKINVLFEFQTPHGLLPIGFQHNALPIILEHTKSTISNLNNQEGHIIRTYAVGDNKISLSTNEHFSIFGNFIPDSYVNKKLIYDLTQEEIVNDLNLIIIETLNCQTIKEYIYRVSLNDLISDYTKRLLKNNQNFKFIVIDNKEGSYHYDDKFFENFRNLYNNVGLTYDNQLFFITNSTNVKRDYYFYLNKNNYRSFMTVHDINFFITPAANTITEYFGKTNSVSSDILVEHNYLVSIPTDNDLSKRRNKYFLNLNRNSDRRHRPRLVLELIKQNLFNKGIISLLKSEGFNKFANENGNEEYKELILRKYPFVIDHDNPEYVANLNQYMTKSDIWLNTYFSIVSETSVSGDCCFITEKTIKPIIYCHPFIVWGNPYTLRKLKELGFETFPEFFDESYDMIIDAELRLHKIIENVKTLCSLEINELHNLYQAIIPKLIKNRNKLIELSKNKYEYNEFLKILTKYENKIII